MNWIKAVLTAAFAILAPVHTIMATSLALIVIDLILGIWGAVKRKETITSAALRRTVTKFMVYQMAIITAFLCEHYLLVDTIPVIKLVSAAIALVECASILENLNEINGSPIFKSIISSLGSKNDKEPPNA